MSEQPTRPELPSGYTEARSLEVPLKISPEQFPWLDKPQDLQLARCTLQDGESFYLASAIGTHPKLVESAEGMNPHQKRNTDNMFYSRVPEVVKQGFSHHAETMPEPTTAFAIFVLRNRGGQRVYFARPTLELPQGMEKLPLIIRLGACDKNQQGKTLSVFK